MPAPGSGNRPPGFTLVELMVVVAVLLVLTALMAGQFGSTYQGELLRSAGLELMGAMKLAWSEAITTHSIHRVRLDPPSGRWWIEGPRRGEYGVEEYAPLSSLNDASGRIDGRVAMEVRSPGELPGQAGPPSYLAGGRRPAEVILFRPDGTADGLEILLRDQEGSRLALRINPTTARVRAVALGKEGSP
jgi:prepilin-type N-terminal cleavage/methylation domain-containing protein